MKMVGIFADIGNLFYCLKKKYPENNKLNYAAYLNYALGENTLYCAKAYGIEHDNEAAKFKTALRHANFEPIYKSSRVIETDGKKDFRRTSWNVGLSMDVVRFIDKLNVVVLGSADPDLAALVEWVKQHGCDCVVVACGISKELKSVATSFKEIPDSCLHVANTPAEATE